MARSRAAVIMTVYNESPIRLDKSVRSVLHQTITDVDVVIVDDGSTQRATVACLEQLARMNPRIRLERIANRGPAGAANHGLLLVGAPLVFRHDSDDWSEPDRFARQIAYMESHPAVVMLGSAVQFHQQDGTPIGSRLHPQTPEEVRAAFSKCNPMPHGALCLRREAVAALGGYRPALRYAEDYDLCWRLSEYGQGTNLPEVLYHHVFHHQSVSVREFRDRHKFRTTVRLLAQSRAHGREMPLQEAMALAAAQDRSPAAAMTGLGDDLLRSGMFGGALRAYLRSLCERGSPRDKLKAGAKLGRLTLYAAVPRVRPYLFRDTVRRALPFRNPRDVGS